MKVLLSDKVRNRLAELWIARESDRLTLGEYQELLDWFELVTEQAIDFDSFGRQESKLLGLLSDRNTRRLIELNLPRVAEVIATRDNETITIISLEFFPAV